MSRTSRGFTLIELLVVIAIIAVLAAILFPVFARARAKGLQTQCLSNMKQLGTAMLAYAMDYDMNLPLWSLEGDPMPSPPNPCHTWDVALDPYVKNVQIYVCPSNPYESASGGNPPVPAGPKRGYSMPRYVSGIYTSAPPNSVDTVLLVEKGAYGMGWWPDAAAESFYQMGMQQVYPTDTKQMPHNDGKDFLFMDGHVKWNHVDQGPFAINGGRCQFSSDWPPRG